MPAYHARPKNADGPLPIVIVVQEIFGVHEHIRDLCRRLAQEGYLAIAPELYFRQGDPNEYTISQPCSKSWLQGAGRAGAGGSRPRRQLGGASRRRCPSSADHRLLLGRTHYWLYAAHNPQLKAAWPGTASWWEKNR
jgi:carboxymethylenebutenolidase